MKSITKFLLVGAVAVMAMAVSSAPSEAKGAKKLCTPGATCTMRKTGVVHHCAGDRKWVAILLPACKGAGCPPRC